MMTDVPEDSVSAAPTPAVTLDMPCAHCGYNLRGLATEGRCPECGFTIAPSVRGDLLRFADTNWLRQLKFGTTLKLWNILVAILVTGLAIGIMIAGLPQVLILLPVLVAGGLGLWAVFLITSPEPRLSQSEDPMSLRKAVRLCAVLSLSGELAKHAGESAAGNTALAMKIIGTVLTVAGVVQAFGELVYFRRFARRMPAPKLERSTTIVLWGLPASLTALLLGVLLAAFITVGLPGPTRQTSGIPMAVGAPFFCVGLIGMVVFFLWYIGLLLTYRNGFQDAIDASQEDL